MEIESLGMGTQHDVALTVERPQGLPNAWLVMCFATPFWCHTLGETVHGQPGDCVIHPPGSPHGHGSLPGTDQGFCNDWIHLTGSEMEHIAVAYDLPINQVVATKQPRLLLPFLERIQREIYLRDPYWEASVRLITESMLLEITRQRTIALARTSHPSPERGMQIRLTEVRIRVHQSLQDPWTVPMMAQLAGLSANRFSVLYKRFFHVSPIDDLISRRMEQARRLLTGTNAGVGEVARLCGFNNDHYFSRLFRQRLGVPPSVYAHLKRPAASDENTPGDADP